MEGNESSECKHFNFQRNVECELKSLSKCCCVKNCQKGELVICFQCDAVFCMGHFDLHFRNFSRMRIEEEREIISPNDDGEKNVRKVEETVKDSLIRESKGEHCVYLDLDSFNIFCHKCQNKKPIHPVENIHGMGYRFTKEYYEKEKRYPQNVVLTSDEYVSLLTNSVQNEVQNPKNVEGEEGRSPAEFLFLVDVLFKLIQLGGRSGKDMVVCEFIERFIKEEIIEKKDENCGRNIQVIPSKDYGVCAIDEPLEKNKEKMITILIDAHVDQVSEAFLSPPLIFPNAVCMGTGFDDRVSVAIMLTHLRFFVPQENLRIIYLFSRYEESGYTGFSHFLFEDEKIGSFIRGPEASSPLSEIICLDVTYGRIDHLGYKNQLRLFSGRLSNFLIWWFDNDPSRLPKIGNGIIVNFERNLEFEKSESCRSNTKVHLNDEDEESESDDDKKKMMITIQWSGIKPRKKEFRYTNMEVTKSEKFGRIYGSNRISKGCGSVVVVDMHDPISFCSLVDAFDLYRYIKLRCSFLDTKSSLKEFHEVKNPKNL